ncbi:MAG: hypothetical protein WD737_01800 [Gemmatimonadota bacterium]
MMYLPIHRTLVTAVAAAALALAGCSEGAAFGDADARASEGMADAEGAPTGVVDSIFPIQEEIRRFKLTVDGDAERLTGGAESREALVSGFVSALERLDTAALARGVIDRAEFIDLYFPGTVYVEPPYEMDPAIIWFQMTNNSSRGITRAFRRLGGRSLAYGGHSCASSPRVEGHNRIWERCVVRIAPDGGEEIELRLFGLILERDGRFKFVTYGNEL